MQPDNFRRSLIAVVAFCVAGTVNATIVEIETSVGTFEVNLYDLGTPETVANFLDYVNNGAYSESFFHRSAPGFIVQSGGFMTDMNGTPSAIPQNASINNEPVYSNVRGSIAMAKLGSGPDTATSQWFFNLANNASSAADLDNQNGGFTVFGEVTGSGMAVVDAIAAIPVYDQGGVYAEIPLQNYTQGNTVAYANLIVVTQITVTDTTVDSAGAAGLNPALSTASSGGGGNGGGGGGGNGGGGGGSLGLFALLGLSAIGRRRYRLTKAA